MDQASGGDDSNKPSKKKSSEDEGKNKKLVGIQSGTLLLYGCALNFHKQWSIQLSTQLTQWLYSTDVSDLL